MSMSNVDLVVGPTDTTWPDACCLLPVFYKAKLFLSSICVRRILHVHISG